jgi:hypothetical protein
MSHARAPTDWCVWDKEKRKVYHNQNNNETI